VTPLDETAAPLVLPSAPPPALPEGAVRQTLDLLREKEARLLEILADYPTEALVGTLVACSVLYYRAEAGKNPRVRSFVDALHYISTCFSVGYANIFPVTQAGKLIAAFVMLFGPALSSRGLEPPASLTPQPDTNEQRGPTRNTSLLLADIAHKLDAILAELRRR
jgi:hypothetical protein